MALGCRHPQVLFESQTEPGEEQSLFDVHSRQFPLTHLGVPGPHAVQLVPQ